jgi:hypothetical protein
MDDYRYATLGVDGWFRCDGLHRPRFPTLLRDVLHRFGYTGFPVYRGRPYHQFGLGRCKVHVDIPAHPTDPTMTAWFSTAQGDDLDDTLERAAHQALTEFCERHLPVLGDTAIALLPVRNEGNAVWSERVTAISDLVSDPPFGLGPYCTLLPVRELSASGGHNDGHSPAPPSGRVRRSGEG